MIIHTSYLNDVPVAIERSTLKAAILTGQNAPLLIEQVDIPHLDTGQVLVKVEYSGICGKQLEEISGKRGPDQYIPHLLGHEGSGVVTEIGPGVTKVKEGDHVVLHWMKGSGINSNPPRFSHKGTVISAGWITTFSEYTIVSENRLTPISTDVSLEAMALLGCAVTTGLGIVFNNGNLKPGQSIAIFGVGGVGLNVVQGARLVHGHPIVAVDILQSKLDVAMGFGATHTILSNGDDLTHELRNISGPQGFDVSVDVTGNNQVRQLAYNVTSDSGITIFAGVPDQSDQIKIDSFPLHFGRRIIGSHGGDTNPDVDIPRYINLYRLGWLKLDEQITHRFPLEDINEAVNIVQKGDAARCVVSMV